MTNIILGFGLALLWVGAGIAWIAPYFMGNGNECPSSGAMFVQGAVFVLIALAVKAIRFLRS